MPRVSEIEECSEEYLPSTMAWAKLHDQYPS